MEKWYPTGRHINELILREIKTAIRDTITATPVSMGHVVVSLSRQLSCGSLYEVASEACIKTHVQQELVKMISKQYISGVLRTVDERTDVYVSTIDWNMKESYKYVY